MRGADVSHTPVALAFAVVHADGTADLFVAGEKVGDDVRAHLGNGVRLHERDAFEPYLRGLERQDRRGRSRALGGGDHAGARGGGGDDPRRARPGGAGEGGQESGSRSPGTRRRRRATGRRSPSSCAGSRRMMPRARSTRSAPRRTSRRCGARPGRSRTCRSTRFPRSGPMARCRIMAGPPTGRSPRGPCSCAIRAGNIRTGRPTSRARCRWARRPTRCATASRACSRGISRSPRRCSRKGTRGSPARQLRAAAAVGSGLRLCPWHGAWRRRVPVGPRGAAADFAGRVEPAGGRRAACSRG